MSPKLTTPKDLRALLRDLDPANPVLLSDEQVAAATAPLEPGVIVAGAGSGKTTVMAARVVWLVGTGAVSPEQVLGLTFTNKAAGELAGRVRRTLALAEERLGESETLAARPPIDGLPAGDATGEPVELGSPAAGEPSVATYHSFAGQLLVEHGLRLGIEPDARLLVDASRFLLARRVVTAASGPFTGISGSVASVVGKVIALDAECSEHLVDLDSLRAHDEAMAAAIAGLDPCPGKLKEVEATARARGELAGLVEAYRGAKRTIGAVDFGDQLAFAAALAEQCPEVSVMLRQRYAVVLLDEYQDTSVAQRRMLAGLFGAGHPVTAVGDPCQSIYGWRGASVANLDTFPTHFPTRRGEPARRDELSESRRCGGRLLNLANTVSASLRDLHDVAELRPLDGAESAGEVICALFDTYAEDVAWSAQQARAAVEDGVARSYREVAVLTRRRSDFAALRSAFVAAGLPVEVVGLGGLLALPEVADVVATLELVDDPTANAAAVRLLTGPRWRIGPRDLALLGRRARWLAAPGGGTLDGGAPNGDAGSAVDLGQPGEPGADGHGDGHVEGFAAGEPASWETIGGDDPLEAAVAGIDPVEVVALADAVDQPGRLPYSAEARQRFGDFSTELRELRGHAGDSLADLIQRVISTIGLDVEASASPEAMGARRAQALAALSAEAAAFAGLDGDVSLGDFLAYLRAADEHDNGLDAAQPSGADAVKLLTAHKAKGLEWDVVILPCLTRSVFPSARSQDRWTTRPHRLPFGLRGDADHLPATPEWTTPGLAAFHAGCKAHDEVEERRLGYVAMTRPRHRLVAAGHWWGPTQVKLRGPSPFLEEIHEHCVDDVANGWVDQWAAEPVTGATNPALGQALAYRWPVELEPRPLAARRDAAARVREDVAALAAGGSVLDPEGLTDDERRWLDEADHDLDLLLRELADAGKRREVELPRTLTATQLMRLRADPRGLARDLARPMPVPPAPAARRGTRLHAWVQAQFDQRPLLGPSDLPGGGDAAEAAEADLDELKAAWAASEYAERAPVAVEAPFELAIAGRVVRGRIDAVYETPGGFEVVDWKTGREDADPIQLAIYRLAWARLRGVDPEHVSAAFCYLSKGGRADRPAPLAAEDELVALLGGPGAE